MAVSVLLIAAAILAGCVFLFKTAHIEVEGAAYYEPEQLVAASGVTQGDNLFLLNRSRIVSRIFAELPYVDRVVILRRLPDTLVISITECKAVAVLAVGGEDWLIDVNGKLLEQTDQTEAAVYAVVKGFSPTRMTVGTYFVPGEGDQERREQLLTLLGQMTEKNLMTRVTEIDLSSPTEISFVYEGFYTVVLPAKSDYSNKLRFFLSVEEQLRNMEEIRGGRIDLTREEAHFIPDPPEE